MSIDDVSAETHLGSLPEPDLNLREAPEPTAHGAGVQAVFNDLDLDGGSVYDRFHELWSDEVGDRDLEPYVVAAVDHDDVRGLTPARGDREYALVLTSSRWKAGTGEGDSYSAWYQYHLKLREVDAEGETYKPPIALHLEVLPQKEELVYKDGNELELPYGEGSRVICSTTWAETAVEIETRMIDALRLVLDVDDRDLLRTRRNESRRIQKAEAHVRFHIGYKKQVVDSLRQSEELIAFGGMSEIDAHRKRQREGWLEAVLDAERWHLLGFERTSWDVELKVYQASHWAQTDPSEPAHHPKLEASFSGVSHGELPHVEEWDETMQILRSIVSAHLEWSGVGREELVADDFFDGSAVPTYEYRHPEGRREQLRARFEEVATEVYREALKANTTSVYDILETCVEHSGATYDYLEERTGLARSTIRYHVRRLEERGVVSRVGNPVLVVFPSRAVLEEAEEILDRVYPGDLAEDRAERADDRRQRRQELAEERAEADEDDGDASDEDVDLDLLEDAEDDSLDASDDVDDDEDELDEVDVATGADVDDLDSDPEWVPLEDLPLDPDQLAAALDRDHLEPDHVRVRTDPYGWLS